MVQPLSRLNLALNRPSGLVAFSPDDIANLDLWMDANDASTYDVDGNDLITEWRDKSTNAHVATPVTSGIDDPSITTVGSVDVVKFDAGNINHFTVPNHASLIPGTGRFTAFVVYRKRGAVRGNFFNMGDDKPRYEMFANSDAGPGGRAAVSFADSVDIVFASNEDFDAADNTLRGLAVTRDTGGDYPHWQLLAAGKSALTLSPLEGTVVGDIDPSTVLYIGARIHPNPNAHYLDGDIGEILIYMRGLTDGEIDQINDYLSAKWSL